MPLCCRFGAALGALVLSCRVVPLLWTPPLSRLGDDDVTWSQYLAAMQAVAAAGRLDHGLLLLEDALAAGKSGDVEAYALHLHPAVNELHPANSSRVRCRAHK